MWPFRKKDAPPWYQEAHDKLRLAELDLERRLIVLETRFDQTAQGVLAAKQLEARVAGLALATRQAEQVLADEGAAWRAQIEQVRGLATGARGGRPRNEEREAERQALAFGQRVIQAAATPEGRAQLILELQAAGMGSSATDAVGGVKVRAEDVRPSNGSPV